MYLLFETETYNGLNKKIFFKFNDLNTLKIYYKNILV